MGAKHMRCINASGWKKITLHHLDIYSPNVDLLTFLKRQNLQSASVAQINKMFRDFYRPFACVITNHQTHEFFLVRDHFGFEPFYYVMPHHTSKPLCFGSTLPDILTHLDSPMLDTSQVSDVLMNVCFSSLKYTDQTYYKHVFRVTPGHTIHLSVDGSVVEQRHKYWGLEPGTPQVHYTSDANYDSHFEVLLQEACEVSCEQSPDAVALEFSGGLDSSSILTTLNQLNITPQLLMHAGENSEERRYGEQLVQELQITPQLNYIGANDFNIIATLDLYKQWFAGGAPYLFFMLAANIHAAAQQKGCKILLSGFGGDECVSSHAPLRTYGAEVGFKTIWQILKATKPNDSSVGQLCRALLYSHPKLYYALQKIKQHPSVIAREQALLDYQPYNCLQEREASWLTGPLSHHIRMRVEYSAVVAKYMGFKYQYPLLYPPLVEYCFALPPEQKRRFNQNRFLMRNYLTKHVSSGLYNTYKKCGSIFPGTMPKCQAQYNKGELKHALQNLPYAETYDTLVKSKRITDDRIFHIDLLRYMFKKEDFS